MALRGYIANLVVQTARFLRTSVRRATAHASGLGAYYFYSAPFAAVFRCSNSFPNLRGSKVQVVNRLGWLV